MILSPYKNKDAFACYNEAMDSGIQLMADFPWQDKTFYGMWLSQIYYFVCHATRLIPFAASRFSMDDERFHARCIEHGSEEKGHQYMALADIQGLGFDIADFEELLETKQFYQNQYWMIQNVDPIALFGINLYMEGMSLHVGKIICRKLLEAHGEKVSQFVIEHCMADEQHIVEAFNVVKSLDVKRQDVVRDSLLLAQMNFEAINSQVLTLWKKEPVRVTPSPSLQL